MSSVTGFTTGGFFPREPVDIEADYQSDASGVLEEINFGPGSPLYQLFKIFKLREYQMELYIKAMVSGLSTQLAYGDFLDKHGEEKGIFRKGPVKAGGYVRVTMVPPAAGANYDLLGSNFYTKKGYTFNRSQTGVSQTINRYITITRGVSTFDYLPDPYEWITGVGYQNSLSDGSGTDYSGVWNQSEQYMNWSGVSNAPTTGATWYLEVTGQMIVKQDVVSSVAGSGYNVGANTITTFTSPAGGIPVGSTVNNPAGMTGGADWESDDDYRARILNAPNRTFTLKNIQSIAEDVVGVRAAHVYQALGTDQISVSGSWTATTGITGIHVTGCTSGSYDIITGAMWSQQFSPSNDILTLKRIILKGFRVGHPPPLKIGLRTDGGTAYLSTGTFDTYGVQPPATGIQDIKIPIKYHDMDSNEKYRVDFWCSAKTGASGTDYWDANYWCLLTGWQSGNFGSAESGRLYDPAGNENNHGNLYFKSQFGAAAINVDVAMKDGYSYGDAYSQIDASLDWVDGSGYAPVGIDYNIAQATQIKCYYNATLYIVNDATSSFDTIKDRVDINVETYIENLDPGENVVYSEVYYQIMRDPDVWRVDDLRIYESGGSFLQEDIQIDDGEIAIFEGSTVNEG